jgi:thioredoxin
MHIIRSFTTLSGLLSILGFFLFWACQKPPDNLSLNSNTAVKSINSQKEFEKAMASSYQKLVVIDFYANWCGPCRDLAPILEEMAHELDQSAQFYKLNIDEHRSLSIKKGVTGIPYVALFKEGKKVHSLMGVWPKKSYHKMVKQFEFKLKSNSSQMTSNKYPPYANPAALTQLSHHIINIKD